MIDHTHWAAEEDLDWYFNCSAGAMGLHSNFWGMLSETHDRPASYELDEHELEAATRARRIARALELLPLDDRRALELYYTARTTNLEAFGRVAPLVQLTRAARVAYGRTPSRRHQRPKPPFATWLTRLSARVTSEQSHNLAGDRDLVFRATTEATVLREELLRAFEWARRACKRERRPRRRVHQGG